MFEIQQYGELFLTCRVRDAVEFCARAAVENSRDSPGSAIPRYCLQSSKIDSDVFGAMLH